MRLERLRSETHEMYQKALDLYRISFPSHEQREAISQRRILGDSEYCFSLIYDDAVFVGLVLYWETVHFIYVEHFCILPEMRNRNYGQKVLELLGKGEKVVILEIDPPLDAISIRRKGFYERCGFAENSYPHIHPPYHRGNIGHDLVIMSFPRPITQEEYDGFHAYLESRVMENAFS